MSGKLRDIVINGAVEYARFIYETHWDWAIKWTESPIEAAFFVSFMSELSFTTRAYCLIQPDGPPVEKFPKHYSLGLQPQAVIGDYRVDFVIVYHRPDGTLGRLVVECDGHDFHDRTKEQASRDRERDRYLQTLGYRVFRFTGSDLYRDPHRCANEVLVFTSTDSQKIDLAIRHGGPA